MNRILNPIRHRWGRVIAAAVLAVLAFGTVAAPANAAVLSTDRVKLPGAGIDFGRNWGVGGYLNGAFLDWDLTGGVVTPVLRDGYLSINNAAGTCARIEIDYHDVNHNPLAVVDSATRCSPDNKRNDWSVYIGSFSSANIDHVIVKLDVQTTNGTFITLTTKVCYFASGC